MYNGSHAKANNKPRIRMNKLAILFIAVVMLIGAVVGSTVAFLVTETAPVENKFSYAKLSTEITEYFDGTTKKDVQVTNTGDTAAYIRATYVVTWRDMNGNVVPSVPGGYSYSLKENPDGKWKKIGDYFYYPYAIGTKESTDGSLLTCTVTHPDNPEYVLHVEILASAIQSTPEDAVKNAWGVTIANGVVTAVSGN
jgi:ketosteroid isomerase-like protein